MNDEYIGDEPDFAEMALIEDLAELEHEQWAHWTQYMLDFLNGNIPEDLKQKRILQWRRQIDTSYKNLSEKEKESDREWARKVMKILKKYGLMGA